MSNDEKEIQAMKAEILELRRDMATLALLVGAIINKRVDASDMVKVEEILAK